tara:strand:+ start:9060 stop:9296 length:237 start_codon:yes stop_codon:yes gene_type:complete
MPQIGWFEILIIVVVAILVIGPKDFPVMLNKIGKWIGSVKKYFTTIQQDISDIGSDLEDEISIEEKYSKKSNFKKKDE